MSSWISLVKKEFLLTRAIFIAAIVFIFVVWGFSYVLDYLRIGEANVEINESAFAGPMMLILMTGGVFMHVFYMPIYIIISMQKELNTFHLWLHTPQPMIKLLSAKLMSGLLCMVISLFINGTIALSLVILHIPEEFMPSFWNTVSFIGLFGGALIGSSVYFGLYVLLYVAIYLLLRGKIGKWTWPVIIGLFMLMNWIFSIVEKMNWHQALMEWGTITINIEAEMLAPIFPMDISAGFLLVHLLFALVLFAIATFLIDRKAEV